jgi:arsenite-transporting ATPase
VVVNRVLPPDADGEFYRSRRAQEQVYIDEIRQRFTQFPLVWIPQLPTDVYGLEHLERISSVLMQASDAPK